MKGQVVLEFLIVTALAVLISIAYLAMGTDLLVSKSEEQRVSELNTVGYMVQDEMILAATVQDGYLRSFVIPEKAGRFAYTISNDENTLTLNSGNVILNYPLPEMNGTFQQGTNVVRKNGVITVNS